MATASPLWAPLGMRELHPAEKCDAMSMSCVYIGIRFSPWYQWRQGILCRGRRCARRANLVNHFHCEQNYCVFCHAVSVMMIKPLKRALPRKLKFRLMFNPEPLTLNAQLQLHKVPNFRIQSEILKSEVQSLYLNFFSEVNGHSTWLCI